MSSDTKIDIRDCLDQARCDPIIIVKYLPYAYTMCTSTLCHAACGFVHFVMQQRPSNNKATRYRSQSAAETKETPKTIFLILPMTTQIFVPVCCGVDFIRVSAKWHKHHLVELFKRLSHRRQHSLKSIRTRAERIMPQLRIFNPTKAGSHQGYFHQTPPLKMCCKEPHWMPFKEGNFRVFSYYL